MEKMDAETLLQGLKKSLQLLKKVDEETYNAFIRNIEKFSRNEILSFFDNMEQDVISGEQFLGARALMVETKKQSIKNKPINYAETKMFYDNAFKIYIQSFRKGISGDCYHEYCLSPLIEKVENYKVGGGTVFFEKTTTNVLDKNKKLYYGIKKSNNGFELFVQDIYSNVSAKHNTKKIPDGNDCEFIK